jgi:hypothetical protein
LPERSSPRSAACSTQAGRGACRFPQAGPGAPPSARRPAWPAWAAARRHPAPAAPSGGPPSRGPAIARACAARPAALMRPVVPPPQSSGGPGGGSGGPGTRGAVTARRSSLGATAPAHCGCASAHALDVGDRSAPGAAQLWAGATGGAYRRGPASPLCATAALAAARESPASAALRCSRCRNTSVSRSCTSPTLTVTYPAYPPNPLCSDPARRAPAPPLAAPRIAPGACTRRVARPATRRHE